MSDVEKLDLDEEKPLLSDEVKSLIKEMAGLEDKLKGPSKIRNLWQKCGET